jgi:hypothetical protein
LEVLIMAEQSPATPTKEKSTLEIIAEVIAANVESIDDGHINASDGQRYNHVYLINEGNNPCGLADPSGAEIGTVNDLVQYTIDQLKARKLADPTCPSKYCTITVKIGRDTTVGNIITLNAAGDISVASRVRHAVKAMGGVYTAIQRLPKEDAELVTAETAPAPAKILVGL